MKNLMAVLVVLSVMGCGFDKADAFRKGVPATSSVQMKVPEGAQSSQPLTGTGTRRDGLEGQTAELYRTTRQMTVFVNGGTAAVLNLVHRITQYPATSVTQDSATWGPHTDALSPNTWKLSVTRTATDTYSYTLEGKGKTEADSAYRVVLSGTHLDLGAVEGSGSFLVDFDQAHQLPENDGNVGTVAVTYSRPSLGAELQIDAQFENVKSDAQLVDAQYRYRATPGQGGSFNFEVNKDFGLSGALENGKIRSRWLESGAGRSDVQASGGDLATTMVLSECWDTGFLSRFVSNSFAPSSNYGTESLCAFSSAEFATF